MSLAVPPSPDFTIWLNNQKAKIGTEMTWSESSITATTTSAPVRTVTLCTPTHMLMYLVVIGNWTRTSRPYLEKVINKNPHCNRDNCQPTNGFVRFDMSVCTRYSSMEFNSDSRQALWDPNQASES